MREQPTTTTRLVKVSFLPPLRYANLDFKILYWCSYLFPP